MTGCRSLTILAIGALLAAGCGASPAATSAPTATTVPSAGPPSTAAGTPGPSGTPAPSSTFAPAATPAPGCSSLDAIDLTDLDVELSSVYPNGDGGLGGFSIGLVYGQLKVTRLTELSGERRSVAPPAREIDNAKGLMLGGREFTTFASFDRYGETQEIVDGSASLTLEGGPAIVLPTRIVPGNPILNQIAVTVPDVSGSGSVTLEMAWTDDCFRYDATGTIPVEVVPFRETANCELDEALYWDDLHAYLKGSITVGTTTPVVGSAFNESKYAPYGNPGIDAFIGYMFDADAPEQAVEPGTTLRIDKTKPSLHLGENMTVVIWTRRSIADAVKDYPPDGMVEVFEGRLQRQAGDSYALPVPDEAGRYVAALSVRFESPCTKGTLWAVVNIAVT